MNYRALVARLRAADPGVSSINPIDVTVTGVTHDSRNVKEGFLFAALPGNKVPGTAFIQQALERGAVAVLTNRRLPESVPQIIAPNPRQVLGTLASIFHGQPSTRLTVMGVTGTNGKTTSASLLQHIFAQADRSCGLIGTVEVDTIARCFEANMTTPESPDLQAWFGEMVAAGGVAAAMEVSSHALHQDRLAGTTFAAGLFTNLTQDHLDYHGTLDEYFDAKARLFRMLGPSAVAVSNLDDPRGRTMLGFAKCRRIGFGFAKDADVRGEDLDISVEGMHFRMVTKFAGTLDVISPLTGRFNASNVLGAASVALALGIPPAVVLEAIATFTGAPGRLERVFVPGGQPGPAVFVDYAHTPDALENVCSTLRTVCNGRKLVTVFGCGGDRDRTKRPKMGAIAQRLSDAVVVTSDNPRTEKPDAIIDDILAGMSLAEVGVNHAKGLAETIVQPDRAAAIREGVRLAGNEGVLLIAGKGHEDYQIVGTTKHHFDDREQARVILAGVKGGQCAA